MTKKILLLAVIAGLVTLFFCLGLQGYLTLEFVKDSQERFQALYTLRPVVMIAVFVAVYIPVIALNLPGAAILGLGAGALFGAWTGTVIVSFASTMGATLACLLSRYLMRDWVQKRFGDRLERINDGIRREGAFYLFSMRLIPVIPFFIINMAMGLTPMRLRTFYWVSQMGMLPGTFIYVNAGSQIARIDSLAGIVSPGLIGSLALLGIFPLVTQKLLILFRNRMGAGESSVTAGAATGSSALFRACQDLYAACTDCGACRHQCAFLTEVGTPKQLLARNDTGLTDLMAKAYECSLCNLCAAVCPEKLDPGHLFLKARREAAACGRLDLSRYRGILSYERKGSSPLFSWYGLPEGCDTVFFPGCTLPGTRPETTWKLFRHLQAVEPTLGIVLDCCTKPSHDLGRQDHFEFMFSELRDFLKANKIQTVWVACPNCHKIFNTYGDGIKVETVYEVMNRHDLPRDAIGRGELVVHDPCPLRREPGIQAAVRGLLARMEIREGKSRHRNGSTLCCGEGGSVGCVRPDLARSWGDLRQKEAQGRSIVTYCAGCAGFLNRVTPTIHLADLIFDTTNSLGRGPRVARAPVTYLHRIRLKRRFQKALIPVIQRVRSHDPARLARQRADECTLRDCTRSLGRKGIILCAVFALSIGLTFLGSRLMYMIDAYVYTAEFHAMFIRNNLAQANVEMFADYFRALGPLGCLPYLLLGIFFEPLGALWLPPVLQAGVNQAFGPGLGGLISLVGFTAAGLVFYGLGRFFLGEILPLFRKTRAPLSRSVSPVLGILLVIPHIPVALPAVLGALTRIRFKSILPILLAALLMRIVLFGWFT